MLDKLGIQYLFNEPIDSLNATPTEKSTSKPFYLSHHITELKNGIVSTYGKTKSFLIKNSRVIGGGLFCLGFGCLGGSGMPITPSALDLYALSGRQIPTDEISTGLLYLGSFLTLLGMIIYSKRQKSES